MTSCRRPDLSNTNVPGEHSTNECFHGFRQECSGISIVWQGDIDAEKKESMKGVKKKVGKGIFKSFFF